MTPKEKAEDLVNRFDMIIYTDQDHDSQVKRCALVAVDEMLYWTNEQDTLIWLNDFYSEVKQEITQL